MLILVPFSNFSVFEVVGDDCPTSIRTFRLWTQPGPHSLGLVLNRWVHRALLFRFFLSLLARPCWVRMPTSESFLFCVIVVFVARWTVCSEFSSSSKMVSSVNFESPIGETSSDSASVLWESVVGISLDASRLQMRSSFPSSLETFWSIEFPGKSGDCCQLIWSPILSVSRRSRLDSAVVGCSFSGNWMLIESLLFRHSFASLEAEIPVSLTLIFVTRAPARVGLFFLRPVTRSQTWALQQNTTKRKSPRRRLRPPITREMISKGLPQMLFSLFWRKTSKASKDHKNPKTTNSFMLSICK